MTIENQVKAEREALAFRVLWMLLFALGWQVAEFTLLVVVIVQLVYRLIRGQLHSGLRQFGGSLAVFLGQAARYLTFATEEKPWPFASWPEAKLDESERAPEA